jgi:sugar O-acyltransferase (sialic acid O-acetyltransferase NeuD family)
MKELVFLGASTALEEIIEIIRDINAITPRWDVVAALDDSPASRGQAVQGVPVVGPLADWIRFPDADFVFAIGSHRTRLIRRSLFDKLGVPSHRFPPLVHPRAKVYPSATLGDGVIVHMNVAILGGAVVESFSVITFNAIVGPNAKLRWGAMLASAGIALTGSEIGSCAFVGAASCLAEGVRIGPGAMIGMGTHVHRDIRPGAFVLGNPARELRREQVPQELLNGWTERAESSLDQRNT